MFFSKTTGGFYSPSIHDIPADAVEIDDATYSQLSGKTVIADANGLPVLATPQPLSLADQRAAMQCTAWQLRRALTQKGWRADVEAAVSGSTDQDLKDMWEYATFYHRTHPFVVSMIVTLGKTDADADNLFSLAGSINA